MLEICAKRKPVAADIQNELFDEIQAQLEEEKHHRNNNRKYTLGAASLSPSSQVKHEAGQDSSQANKENMMNSHTSAHSHIEKRSLYGKNSTLLTTSPKRYLSPNTLKQAITAATDKASSAANTNKNKIMPRSIQNNIREAEYYKLKEKYIDCLSAAKNNCSHSQLKVLELAFSGHNGSYFHSHDTAVISFWTWTCMFSYLGPNLSIIQ